MLIVAVRVVSSLHGSILFQPVGGDDFPANVFAFVDEGPNLVRVSDVLVFDECILDLRLQIVVPVSAQVDEVFIQVDDVGFQVRVCLLN